MSLKRGKIGPRLLLMTYRKSIFGFDWCQNQRPWMTLKGHYALPIKRRASFGAHHENVNEDILYCQRRRCSAMTLQGAENKSNPLPFFVNISTTNLNFYKKIYVTVSHSYLRITAKLCYINTTFD